jgi:periplasmic protein TonB
VRIQARHWIASFSLAVGLHAGLLLALELAEPVVVGSGGGVRIALGEAHGPLEGGPAVPPEPAPSGEAAAPSAPTPPQPVSPPPEPEPRAEPIAPPEPPPPAQPAPRERAEAGDAAAPPEARPASEGEATGRAQAPSGALAAASPAGAGPPAPGRADAATEGEKGLEGLDPEYVRRFMAELERHRQYPRAARVHHLEGTALLWLRMDRGGRVLAYEVEESSGHRLLDRAVLRAIERANPMPPLPASDPRAELEIVVPIAFRLQ